MAKVPGQPFSTIEIPLPKLWNHVRLRDWCLGEHERCYQRQPAYSTRKLQKELKTRSNRRNRRPTTIMIAQPNFCQKGRLGRKWELHLQNAASHRRVQRAWKAIRLFLLGEDLENNSSQETTQSETYITAKARKVLTNTTHECCWGNSSNHLVLSKLPPRLTVPAVHKRKHLSHLLPGPGQGLSNHPTATRTLSRPRLSFCF